MLPHSLHLAFPLSQPRLCNLFLNQMIIMWFCKLKSQKKQAWKGFQEVFYSNPQLKVGSSFSKLSYMCLSNLFLKLQNNPITQLQGMLLQNTKDTLPCHK